MSSKKKNRKSKANLEPSKAGAGTEWWTVQGGQNSTFTTPQLSFNDAPVESKEKKKKSKKTSSSRGGGKSKGKSKPTSRTTKTGRSRSLEVSDDLAIEKDVVEKPEDEEPEVPLVLLENPSPPFWTYGSIFVFVIVLVCEFLQNGGFASMSVNPMFGPTEVTMVLMGAKSAKAILDGEWWRLATALFVHSGAIHLLIMIIFSISSRKLEIETGFWRAVFVFLLAGVFGYILSCLLVPEMVSCGATGAVFGYFGLQLADLISTWRANADSPKRLGFLIGAILVGIVMGLTPFLDNFCNIGGFIMGILFALMLLPNLSFGACERVCHGFIAFIAFPAMTIVFCICLVLFYRRIDGNTWCGWCNTINCININNWCPKYAQSTTENVFYLK